MKIPTLHGIIDRRILANFTADPDVIRKIIPQPFSPLIYRGNAIVGICLIRLKHVRPKGLPDCVSIASENGAHRIAVNWEEHGELKTGVYIPRRDTSSFINSLAGGRVFPGRHFHADFDVNESKENYHVSFKSTDGTEVMIDADLAEHLPPGSIFKDLETASAFFQSGAVGYSPNGKNFDGIRLHTTRWKVDALQVNKVYSSFFSNEKMFPTGSVRFDNALLMTSIEHEWHSVEQKCGCA